jgi:hypothetical protein
MWGSKNHHPSIILHHYSSASNYLRNRTVFKINLHRSKRSVFTIKLTIGRRATIYDLS